MLTSLTVLWHYCAARRRLAVDERGAFSTEVVLLTAALAALAIAAGAVITNKILAKANAIPTN